MRTHIFITLLALILTACASKEHLTAGQEQKEAFRQEQQTDVHYSQIDGSASRVK